MKRYVIISAKQLALFFLIYAITSCGGTNFLNKNRIELKAISVGQHTVDPVQPVEPDKPVNPEDGKQNIPSKASGTLHPMFSGILGMPISRLSMSAVALDPTGYDAIEDYDGDGIPNEMESAGFSNPYTADYPHITTRIDTPLVIEIRKDETDTTQNHSEIINDNDVEDTISKGMDTRQYNQFNRKTTPYETKDSDSITVKDAGSSGYSQGVTVGASVVVMGFGGGATVGYSSGQNKGWDSQLSRSTSSEKTVFEDVDYTDNLNRNGVEYKNDAIERMSRNFRQSSASKSDYVVGPNAGLVRAGLYIVNESINQPARISNVICTLSFRTPSGKCLPVNTFMLQNQDGSDFDVEIYGGEEKGPFTVEVKNLSTFEVKKALRNGYIPQIHVVNYEMHQVEDSNYNPGVDNLRIVEETAKSRTALIKITGPGMREMYRVPAFEVDADGTASPGISLKKALFNIYHNRIGDTEDWNNDAQDQPLTVNDQGLRWKYGFVEDPDRPGDNRYTTNTKGNSWSKFSTCVKSYDDVDKNRAGMLGNNTTMFETIERIGTLKKYNPFNKEDNPKYDPNTPLTEEEFLNLKQWVILHNGRYFNGDINDPIWAGERYEIIFYDARDVNESRQSFYYAPLQNVSEQDTTTVTIPGSSSQDPTGSSQSSDGISPEVSQYSALQSYADFTLNTLWNKEYNNKGLYSRAVYLGKICRGEVIKLEVELDEFRSLFNVDQPGREFDQPVSMKNIGGRIWQKFNYTFDSGSTPVNGKPSGFNYTVWGGCNQILLHINESTNADHYTVSFWPQWLTEESARTAIVTPAELYINNGYVSISSVSNAVQGGTIGSISLGQYQVRVRAHGVSNNVKVTTLGTRVEASPTAMDAPIAITDPLGTGMPDSFTISAEGQVEAISVVVNQGNNAEYYIAEVSGPYNYGHGNGDLPDYIPPKKTHMLYPGNNVIPVPKSDPETIGHMMELTADEAAWAVPGVYKVKVYAVNKNCLDAAGNPNPAAIVPASNEVEAVMVEFNRYEEQKKYLPKRQIEEFNPKDVDFEVNFGEGSGWFRLKLSHDDYTDLSRAIDCRYTTNFVENRGRVTIYFTAPSGPYGEQNTDYNVFRGGAEEAEVYLRTVARPEYRDSVWLKSSDKNVYDPLNTEGYRCININSPINNLPGFDPLKYWITNETTDATMIEHYTISEPTNPRRVFPNLGSGYSVTAGDFAVVAGRGKEDFFFAPMKKLTYRVSASVVEANLGEMMGEWSHVDKPEYRPLGGEQRIMLSNLDSQYAESYFIGWKTKNNAADTYNEIQIPADDAHHSFEISRVNVNGSEQNLITNEEYLVYVVAKSGETYSEKVYSTVKTMPESRAYTLVNPVTATVNNNGHYLFINGAQPITDDTGSIFVPGVDFQYDQPLNNPLGCNIFDSGTSGAFTEGRYLRIVLGGLNITSSPLTMTPIAKNLGTIIYSPPKNQCYIDPARKSFVLPRPNYWSTMDDEVSVTTSPSISEEIPEWIHPALAANSAYKTGCKFGSCYFLDDASGEKVTASLYPFGSGANNMNEGTVSVWIKPTTGTTFCIAYGGAGGEPAGNRVQLGYGTMYIYVNNSSVASIATSTTAAFHHLFAVWNKNGLGDGNRIKVIYDGSTVLSWSGDWNPTGGFRVYSYATGNAGGISVDNIKVWKEAVSLTSTWDYNGGTGRLDSLHPIYGDTNGYKPVLTSPGGVGYYSVPMW